MHVLVTCQSRRISTLELGEALLKILSNLIPLFELIVARIHLESWQHVVLTIDDLRLVSFLIRDEHETSSTVLQQVAHSSQCRIYTRLIKCHHVRIIS